MTNELDDSVIISPGDWFEAFEDFVLVAHSIKREMGGSRTTSLGVKINGTKEYGDIITYVGRTKIDYYNDVLLEIAIQKYDTETGEQLEDREIVFVRNLNQILDHCYYEEKKIEED